MTDVVSLKLATRKCYYMRFTLLTTLANQHPQLSWGTGTNRSTVKYQTLSQRVWRARDYWLCRC